MPTDAHFLAAIAAAPLDALPKLVYADWLDEHDDPRGQLIRLDAELLTTPPADDRYWHLHARRDDLLTGVDADWLAAVRVGNDCAPVLAHGWPDDVKGRWRTVRAAAERLLGRSLGDVGGQADLVNTVVAAIGRPLPESLREWVAFVTDVAGEGVFTGFAQPEWSADGELLLLGGGGRYERMAVPAEHLDAADPRVSEYEDDEEGSWELLTNARSHTAVSEFALFHLLNGCHGTGGRVWLNLTDTGELRKQLMESAGAPFEFTNARLWERPGLVVEMVSHFGRTESVTVSMQESIPPADVPAFLFSIGKDRELHASGTFIPDVLREPRDARTGRLPPGRRFRNLPDLLNQRGVDFRDGRNGRERSEVNALACFRQASELGHAEAATQVGFMAMKGQGMQEDMVVSLDYYHLGADRGSAAAMCSLGAFSRDGRGVPQDDAAAAKWFRRAADGGDTDAMCDLGTSYWGGYGVDQDYDAAVAWYRRAIDTDGNPVALVNLGNANLTGRGLEIDFAEAMRLYTLASGKNCGIAHRKLGGMWEYGLGVPKDLAEALVWYRKGAELGDESSKKKLAELEAG